MTFSIRGLSRSACRLLISTGSLGVTVLLAACGESNTPVTTPVPAVTPPPAPAATPDPAPEPPGDSYTPLEGLRVSLQGVKIRLKQLEVDIEKGMCISQDSDPFRIHSSKWQRRDAGTRAAWADVPETDQTGGLCAFSPTVAGEYRMVAELTIDGSKGMYSSENTLAVAE